MVDLDAFADIHREMMDAARKIKAPPVMPWFMCELATRLSPADVAAAILVTQAHYDLVPADPETYDARRAALMIRLLPVTPEPSQ